MNSMRAPLFLTFLFTLFLAVPALAQFGSHGKPQTERTQDIDWNATEQNVFIELYSDKQAVQGGDTLTLVIEQIIRPHWHTYWENPGDSGEAMKANWTFPDGFSASEISWPTPIKLPFDILLNYGYEGEISTLQTITLPETLPNGTLEIPVRFDILVCKEICIPESVQKTLTITDGQVQLPSDKIGAHHTESAQSFMPQAYSLHEWESTWQDGEENRTLRVQSAVSEADLKKHTIEFFPYKYGLLHNPAEPLVSIEGQTIILSQAKGDFGFEKIENIGGVLVLEDKTSGARSGYELEPTLLDIAATSEKKTNASESALADIGILQALFFALMGGLILNLMPCVFPVLSMKVLSLSKISEKSKSEARAHGLAYTAGIILSFLAIAALLIGLKAGGSGIGWGFHLQNPIVILLLSYLFFVIGLNLAGYFEFGAGLMNIGGGKQKEGLSGSFTTGILATIVATPCTAPFMAAALGYALVQPAFISLLIFAFLGLGLALPYLLIAFIPPLQKLMPRPGNWMVTFKEFLAFPMFATVIWLLWILSQQIGLNGFFIPLIGLLSITLGIWFFNGSAKALGTKKGFLTLCALGFIGIGLFATIFSVQSIEMAKEKPMPEMGSAYSISALEDALKSEHPVFVEMTAAWCVTCKVNHATSIDIESTKEIMARQNVKYLIGDWTNYDADITAYLNKFGRNGVPIYIYYGRPNQETGKRPEPEILPQILTPAIVADALDK